MSRRIPWVWVPVVAATLFVALLVLDAVGWSPLVRWDESVSATFREYGTARPALVAFLRLATDVAATIPFLAVGAAATAVFAARRDRRRALFCGLVTAVVPILWSVMHWRVHSPRPSDGFVAVDSSGFPSGHTSNGAALALAVVLLAWPHLRAAGRWVLCLAAAAFALFIAYTRVALLAHWPSDVLGGLLLAAAVVPAAALTAARLPARRRGTPATHHD